MNYIPKLFSVLFTKLFLQNINGMALRGHLIATRLIMLR
eukprot:UN14978